MATTVGTGNDLNTIIKDFILLERDALEAYDAAIARLSDPAFKGQVQSFKEDHLRHLDELQKAAQEIGAPAPQDSDMKAMLTTGKVAMAGVAGDTSIMKAMASNEVDTITAYENGTKNETVPAALKTMMERALEDEKRHKAYMDQSAQAA